MGQSVLRVVPLVRGLSHRQPSWGISVRALHAASCTARNRPFGPTGLSASRIGYLDCLQPESPLYSKIIKPATFRAYTSDAEKKESEADATDSHPKGSHPPGGSADRRTADTVTITQEAFDGLNKKAQRVSGESSEPRMGLVLWITFLATICAISYPWLMDRTIRDAKGNEIATLDPFTYTRCMVFLQGEESLDEHARAQATEKERSQKHDEENKKAKKEDRERRVKRDEEERMILREDAGRIQISIPHSMVQKCITATSTKAWGDLQEDAKALVAAEWRSRQRNG